MSHAPLRVESVTHRFGSRTVLKDISFSLPKGKVTALLGPNGAGKTTLFRILTGLIAPTEGVVQYGEYNLIEKPVEARREFVYLSDEPQVYPYLSGEEYLHLTAATRGLNKEDVKEHIASITHIFPNLPSLQEPLGDQSRGSRQKILFLGALLSQPRVLLSDEPIVGLDPTSIQQFGDQLRRFADDGGSVLLALHTLDFAEQFADQVIILADGELKTSESVGRKKLQTLYETHTQ
ncbi:ATP-binding cassette domain-containing protein [Candidatus Woesebacteria bacterium]|nr:ATP-binding cassette domain-containing protein [Candidatus Woesebacteria bacterium]MCD8506810.1 ATP-binding cassette domain-containing protein [Candidatus Woesebacteria bacterium]MCD8527039.1 ATP-binding cassette domain-containing protein [Candidatus Woesebacteria bacterium]MCD8546312.1 ATP-binding cassette domain-containing protein [Candidatus Woesebacteria bacterium]